MTEREEILKRRVTAQLARIVPEPDAIALVAGAIGNRSVGAVVNSEIAQMAWRELTAHQRKMVGLSLVNLRDRLARESFDA